jgi:molybdate transport system substrate-binding protein
MEEYMMKKALSALVLMLFAVTLFAGCQKSQENQSSQVNLTISVAASLQDAAQEIKSAYTGQNPQTTITYNFASSGTLQKQIEEGAPVDLFISAGKKQMDALSEKGLIITDSRKDLLENDLVLIVKDDSNISDFEGLKNESIKKIGIGTPETVPAGKYAKETLTSLNLWEELQPKMVLAKDVRQVLTYVETGNVDAGLVYRSDAMVGKNIKIAAIAPDSSHKPIVYPVAILNNSQNQEEIKKFADFLFSEQAASIFQKYGFKSLSK